MLENQSTPPPAPTNLQELIDRLSERVAATPIEQLIQDHPGLLEKESSVMVDLQHIALKIADALCLIYLVFDRFEEGATALNVSAAVGLVFFFLAERLLQRRTRQARAQVATDLKRAKLRVGLACELAAQGELFEQGNTEDGWLQVLVTFDPGLLADSERFELLTSQCVFALSDGFADRISSDFAKAGATWAQNQEQRGPLPKDAAGGAEAFLGTSMFYSNKSPEGYIDRAFWPVITTDIPGRQGIVAHIPASYWWSKEVDELTEFWGHMGAAYAALEAGA